MKCHQVLTGAVNSGDNTYSVGSVEGIHFVVYSSGCNIVILSSNLERVQIISGVLHGNVQVNCINASTDVGKIAACFGGPIKSHQFSSTSTTTVASSNRILIFEPTPIIGQNSEHRLDYNWIKTAEIEPNSAVNVLSWNIEGTKLLTGGVEIQLWQLFNSNADITKSFASQNSDDGLRMKPIKPTSDAKDIQDWSCVWSCKTSTPVCYLSFSPDGTLFCSTGRSDRLVKIWYESPAQNYSLSSLLDGVSQTSKASLFNPTSSSSFYSNSGHPHSTSNISFSFIYIAHPRAVTGISWRKVSKYMPKCSVANMLVTSCRDNICRLWVQTFLPEDGLVNVSQLDGVSNLVAPRAQTQRHRQKIIQRLKHIRHFKRRHHTDSHDEMDDSGHIDGLPDHLPIPNLPSTFSVHDFHGYGVHGTSISPGGLHFHLTATINPENDIPLVPSLAQHPSDNDLSSTNIGPKVTVSNEPRATSPTEPQLNMNSQHSHHHHEESDKPLFVVNWLNNKEMAFTQSAEIILHEIVANIIQSERQKTENVEADDVSESSCTNTENTVDSVIRLKPLTPKNLENQSQQMPSSLNSSSTNSLVTMNAPTGTNAENQTNESNANYNHRTVADYLDRKLESLMREWHSSSDLLYSIYPLDGSLLVWLVEWLDEPSPSTFRQPQISFSSRIPNSIPIGDASTMSQSVALYSPDCFLDLKTVFCTSSENIINAALNQDQVSEQLKVSVAHKTHQQQNQKQQPLFGSFSNATPTLCMITKHNNGSLNLWKLSFSERSNFTQLLSISHSSRVCGHRFRVNDVTCHPILPLLLTTSHHNLPGANADRRSQQDLQTPNTPDSASFLVSPSTHDHQPMVVESSTFPNTGFCSELILWKVDPVGPLLKSGGLTELARINSIESTSFANVAWIPILLPSTALGSISNSPSACFVASDGHQLRIYQSVIDARSLLAEAQRYMLNNKNDQRRFYFDSSEDESEDEQTFNKSHTTKSLKNDHETFRSLFKIVSLQSTARPGCILELSHIVDAKHDWQNTQLLHVFQEQLILGNLPKQKDDKKKSKDPFTKITSDLKVPDGQASVDLVNVAHSFEEIFYLVVVEKTGTSSTLHMWQIIISSRTKLNMEDIDTNHSQPDDEDSSRSVTPDKERRSDHQNSNQSPPIRIKTKKVCVQKLSIPSTVEIIHATPAAGHLSSSNVYPACYAPFLISTACSDNKVRFWRCNINYDSNEPNFEWNEWMMNVHSDPFNGNDSDSSSSALELPGSPLYVSCAYSSRIACAFKFGHSFVDLPTKDEHKLANEKHRFINIGIAIFECQSSGGSEWILEDTIKIDRIPLMEPSTSVTKSQIDIAPLVDTTLRNQQASRKLMTKISSNASLASNNPFATETLEPFETVVDPGNRVASITRLLSVPSYTTLQSLKKIIAEQGNQFTFFQKSPVLLDWVSTEDGCHILTCSVAHKIALFAPVSYTPPSTNADMNKQASSAAKSNTSVSLIPQQSISSNLSVSPSNFRMNILDPLLSSVSITRWMILRINELDSVDGLPPLPMQLSWVRDGILVVGMDNEMLVFTQWKMSMPTSLPTVFEGKSTRKPKRPMATYYPFDSVDFPNDLFVKISRPELNESSKGTKMNESQVNSGEKIISDLPEDFGLFEAFRLSSPVIPQYHPKQLMELLAFGKIHRVRAILSHLVASLCSINSIKEYLHHPANMQQQHGNSFESERSPRPWTRTRALSVAAQNPSPHETASPNENSYCDSAPIVAEEIQLDYTEIASIRPLPLYALIQADEGVHFDKSKNKEDKFTKNDSASWSLDRSDSIDPNSLFDYGYKTQVEETLDEFMGNRTAFNFSNVATSKFLKNQQAQQPENENDLNISINFDQRQARVLTKLLTHSHLPGLTSLDQMHLLALADSLASFDEISGNDQNSDADNSKEYLEDQQLTITADSLDDCGLRYLLNMRQHIYLLKCLPLMQRKSLQRNGLGLHNIIWAFHSETQEELVQLILSTSNKINWQELRELGVGFWVRNNTLLKKIIEKLAKSAFKAKNDPLDASLYYLAMKKKNLVWGLYRSIQDKKMTDFFAHDFTEEKWRKAALKNAYVLMGKQRFEHAVSFFLLAGSLWDAVEICINKLDDLQLAMVIIRLYEGSDMDSVPETFKKLLNEEILGYNKSGVQDMQYAHPDPFLRSMANWMIHEYNLALSTLLEVNVGSKHIISVGINGDLTNSVTPSPPSTGSNFDGPHPSVFNFYLYLRTQPLIVRRAQVAQQNVGSTSASVLKNQTGPKSKKSHMFSSGSVNRFDAVAITLFERRLFFLTAYRHLQAGCPSLALEVLSRLPANIMSYSKKNEIEECSRRMSIHDSAIGLLSDSKLVPQKESKAEDLFASSSNGFDWGSTPSSLFAPVSTDDFELKFDDDYDQENKSVSDDADDKQQLKEMSDEEEKVFEDKATEEDADKPTKIDVIAQQFKFISCLKILMEELSTLATGFEVDGGQLRYQLYIWLERSVQILKEICNYHTFSMRSSKDRSSIDGAGGKNFNGLVPPFNSSQEKYAGILVNVTDRKPSDNSTNSPNGAPSLHEILIANKADFESKLERCHRRKTWLTANEALLRNLLSYCSLHGAHGGGLASVRMELILLLQELQQDRSPQQQLLSPLPLPTTLPILTASVASQKTVIADPIRHLQSVIHDILQTLTDSNTYVHLPTDTEYSTLPDFLALPPFMVSGTATGLTSWPSQEYQTSNQQPGSYFSNLYALIHILRDLGISLSSCIYQSLCDCDTVMQNSTISSNNPKSLSQLKNSHISQTSKKSFSSLYKDTSDSIFSAAASSDEKLTPNTAPIKWPGVQSLHSLIVREKDEDLPKLHTLLCEGFVAVYLSQLVYALTICDSSILYRLVGLNFTEKSWGELFGGGTKKLLYVSTATGSMQTPGTISPNELPNGSTSSPHIDLINTLSKQRMKLHMKILEQLNAASAAASAAGAAAAEAVSAVSQGMVNVATSPSTTFQNIGMQFSQPTNQPGATGLAPVEQRPTYRELFVPPQISIINSLMIKPELPDDLVHLDYDSLGSDDEVEDENQGSALGSKFQTDEIDDDEYEDWANGSQTKASKSKVDRLAEKRKANMEYDLYAWCIIRLAVTKLAFEQLNKFLTVSGLEKGDLPSTSSFIHATLRTLFRWQCALRFYMNEFTNIPDHFLPNMFVDTEKSQGPVIQKYKSLFETNNTPFRSGLTSTKSSKRLWNYLVRQPLVQEIFIRYIFGKNNSLKMAREYGATSICNASTGSVLSEQTDSDHKTMQPSNEGADSTNLDHSISSNCNKRLPEPMRIVHKDQDIITAFCVNKSNPELIALSTPKEIQELNIKSLLNQCVPWMEEGTELDILNLRQRYFSLSTNQTEF